MIKMASKIEKEKDETEQFQGYRAVDIELITHNSIKDVKKLT